MSDYLHLQKDRKPTFSNLPKLSAYCSGIPGSSPLLQSPVRFETICRLRSELHSRSHLELPDSGSMPPIPTVLFPTSPFGKPALILNGKGWCWFWCWPLQRQQFLAITCLQKALFLEATQWSKATALASTLASLRTDTRAGGERSAPPARQTGGRASHINLREGKSTIPSLVPETPFDGKRFYRWSLHLWHQSEQNFRIKRALSWTSV